MNIVMQAISHLAKSDRCPKDVSLLSALPQVYQASHEPTNRTSVHLPSMNAELFQSNTYVHQFRTNTIDQANLSCLPFTLTSNTSS